MVFRRETAGDEVGRILAAVSKRLWERENRGNQPQIRFVGMVRVGVCTPKPVTKTLMVQSLEETISSSLLVLCEPILPCV